MALITTYPAAAKICTDQGTITALQVSASGPDPQYLQVVLDGRATYVATSALPAPVFTGLAALASGAYLAGRPVRVGFEQGPTANNIQFIEVPMQGNPGPAPGCGPRGGAAARR